MASTRRSLERFPFTDRSHLICDVWVRNGYQEPDGPGTKTAKASSTLCTIRQSLNLALCFSQTASQGDQGSPA